MGNRPKRWTQEEKQKLLDTWKEYSDTAPEGTSRWRILEEMVIHEYPELDAKKLYDKLYHLKAFKNLKPIVTKKGRELNGEQILKDISILLQMREDYIRLKTENQELKMQLRASLTRLREMEKLMDSFRELKHDSPRLKYEIDNHGNLIRLLNGNGHGLNGR